MNLGFADIIGSDPEPLLAVPPVLADLLPHEDPPLLTPLARQQHQAPVGPPTQQQPLSIPSATPPLAAVNLPPRLAKMKQQQQQQVPVPIGSGAFVAGGPPGLGMPRQQVAVNSGAGYVGAAAVPVSESFYEQPAAVLPRTNGFSIFSQSIVVESESVVVTGQPAAASAEAKSPVPSAPTATPTPAAQRPAASPNSESGATMAPAAKVAVAAEAAASTTDASTGKGQQGKPTTTTYTAPSQTPIGPTEPSHRVYIYPLHPSMHTPPVILAAFDAAFGKGAGRQVDLNPRGFAFVHCKDASVAATALAKREFQLVIAGKEAHQVRVKEFRSTPRDGKDDASSDAGSTKAASISTASTASKQPNGAAAARKGAVNGTGSEKTGSTGQAPAGASIAVKKASTSSTASAAAPSTNKKKPSGGLTSPVSAALNPFDLLAGVELASQLESDEELARRLQAEEEAELAREEQQLKERREQEERERKELLEKEKREAKEREKLAREEKEREKQDKLVKEKQAREQQAARDRERAAKEKADKERAEREKAEKEKVERDRAEKERLDKIKKEKEAAAAALAKKKAEEEAAVLEAARLEAEAAQRASASAAAAAQQAAAAQAAAIPEELLSSDDEPEVLYGSNKNNNNSNSAPTGKNAKKNKKKKEKAKEKARAQKEGANGAVPEMSSLESLKAKGQAAKLREEGKTNEALELLTASIVSSQPGRNLQDLLLARADLYLSLNKPEEANKDCLRVLTANETDHPLAYALQCRAQARLFRPLPQIVQLADKGLQKTVKCSDEDREVLQRIRDGLDEIEAMMADSDDILAEGSFDDALDTYETALDEWLNVVCEPNDDRNLDEAWEDAAKLSKAWRLRRARLILATGEFQAARLATAQVPEDSLDPDFLYVRALAVMLEDGPDSVTQVDEILKKGGALKKGSTNKCQLLSQTAKRITDLRHQASLMAKNKPLEANAMWSQCMTLFSRISDPVSLGWFKVDPDFVEDTEEDPWRQGGFAGVRILCSIGNANLSINSHVEAESAFRNALSNLWDLLGTGPALVEGDDEDDQDYPLDIVAEGSPWLNTIAQAHAGRGYALAGMKKWSEATEEFETALKISPKNAEYTKMLKKVEEDDRKEREAAAAAEAARQRQQEQARKERADEQARARARAQQQQQQQQYQQQQQQQRSGTPPSGGGSSSGGGSRRTTTKVEGRVDYFEILGVSAEASDDEIKRAYRKLAMTFHPDRHMTATQEERLEQETKFKSISEAYNVLSDPEKRRKWEEGDDYDFAVPADFQEMLMKLFMQSFMGAAAAGGGGRGNRRGKGDPFASFFFGGGAFDFGGYDDDYGGGGRYYCESCGTYHDADDDDEDDYGRRGKGKSKGKHRRR